MQSFGAQGDPPPHTRACTRTHIHTQPKYAVRCSKFKITRLCTIISAFAMGAKGLMIFQLHRFNVKCLAKCKQWTRVVVEERSCSLVYRIIPEFACRNWGKPQRSPVTIASFKFEWTVWWISYESKTQKFFMTYNVCSPKLWQKMLYNRN